MERAVELRDGDLGSLAGDFREGRHSLGRPDIESRGRNGLPTRQSTGDGPAAWMHRETLAGREEQDESACLSQRCVRHVCHHSHSIGLFHGLHDLIIYFAIDNQRSLHSKFILMIHEVDQN